MRSYLSPAKRRLAGVAAAAALLLALVGTALGTSYIDLTTAGASGTDADGGTWVQGTGGAGTGNFDPFLTMQSTPSETGVNVCDDAGCPDPQFDTTGVPAGRTHEILASAIPVLTDPGDLTGDYRAFSLDSNDTGADDWVSVDEVEIYLTTNKNQTYPPPSSDLIYSLPDDTSVLLRSQALSSGSGQSDLTLFIPDSYFPDNCYYGSTSCNLYVWFYTEIGYAGTVDGRDFSTNAGFEEWRVSLQPVVDVQKSVDTSYERTHTWDVEKSASVESIDLFAGDTASIDWSVTVKGTGSTDGNVEVTGDIDILNPTGSGYAISEAIPATILGVDDVMELNGVGQAVDVNCPVSFPYVLGAGDTLTCTYTAAPLSTEDGTNTATATIVVDPGDSKKSPPIPATLQDYSDTVDVLFADATVNEIDECIDVADDNATPGDTTDDFVLGTVCQDDLDSNDEYTFAAFSTDVGPFGVEECDSTTITNTAYTETNDSETTDSANDSVNATCYELSVEKTAETSLTRTWTWDVDKTSDVGTVNLFAGDSGEITWTVTVTGLGSSDSAWHVEGDITITNPAPMIAEDVALTDSISGGFGSVGVDCDSGTAGNQTTVDVPAASGGADGSVTCTYEAYLLDATARTNTATATLFGEQYSDDAAVDFTGATVDDINECVDVTDDNTTPADATDDLVLGQVCLDDLDSNEQYEFTTFKTTVGPFTQQTCGSTSVTNTAYTETNDTETADSAAATVDVNCYELTVEKDATTTYSRDYDWDVAKTRFIASGENDGDGNPLTLTLDEGQTYTASYEITVTMTGFEDANHAVSGTITISNPAPMIAEDVAVADVISPDIPATVDCDGGTSGNQTTADVPAEGSVECSYSAGLPDGATRTNTATATLFEEDYTGSVEVAFDLDNPTTEIDECVDITDDAGTPLDLTDDLDLGTVCIGRLDENDQWTDEYTLEIGPYAICGEYPFTNTVSFVTTNEDNDTDESGSDTYTVTVTVPCPEGCTLTQGYWKTHNDTFHGGAPTDETWDLIGPLSEGEIFFLSGQTYFEVMWTAPQGNAYYNLAHQYIAAQLNMLDGADGSAITTAFSEATVLFESFQDEQIAQLKGKNGKELRAQFITLAGILGSYNEGLIGPGHCDEDPTSAPAFVLPPLLPVRRLRMTA